MSHLTDLTFLDQGQDWPPPSQRERLDAYNANRLLFEGQHEKVFESWPKILRKDVNAALEMVLNFPKRLSTLWADLLVGDPPTYSLGDNETNRAEQTQLDDIVERNRFNSLLYEVGIDMSRYGDAILKVALKNGKAVIGGQSPSFWFPVVSISDVRDVQFHVLAWPFKAIAHKGEPKYRGKKLDMIKVEIHARGQIEHRVLAVGENRKIEHLEAVRDHFPRTAERPGLKEIIATNGLVEDTGVDEFLVQHVPGLRGLDRLYGLNDYTDVETLVQEMEVRIAQIARILDKHADPTLAGPESLVVRSRDTGEAEFVGTGKYIPVPQDEQMPQYIVWDGLLQAAFSELEQLMQKFYLVTETSPAAFGDSEAMGMAASGTALRRLMQAPLAKVARMRQQLDPVAIKTLQLSGELENRGVGNLNLRSSTADESAA